VASRLDRERRTLDRMIHLYCEGNHGSRGALCDECTSLGNYAMSKLGKCPFQEGKPTCGRCTVHCYRPEMRERIRDVMRYAGPRMFPRHPGLSLMHFVDRFRRVRD
jgi:hypothetical protein